MLQPGLQTSTTLLQGMHHVRHVGEKDMKARISPSDHCGILQPNAGRHPCKTGEISSTSTPCSNRESQNEMTFKRKSKHLVVKAPYLQLQCQRFGFYSPSPEAKTSSRWIDERVYQWRTRRLYSNGVFPLRSPSYDGRNGFVVGMSEIARGASTNARRGRCAPAVVIARPGDAVGADDASRWRVSISIEDPVSTWHNLSLLFLLCVGDAGEKYQHQAGRERERGRERLLEFKAQKTTSYLNPAFQTNENMLI